MKIIEEIVVICKVGEFDLKSVRINIDVTDADTW